MAWCSMDPKNDGNVAAEEGVVVGRLRGSTEEFGCHVEKGRTGSNACVGLLSRMHREARKSQ